MGLTDIHDGACLAAMSYIVALAPRGAYLLVLPIQCLVLQWINLALGTSSTLDAYQWRSDPPW